MRPSGYRRGGVMSDDIEQLAKAMERLRKRITKCQHKRWEEWAHNISAKDVYLKTKAEEFEEFYFKDMTLRAYEGEVSPMVGETGVPERFEHDFFISNWIITYGELPEGVNGGCSEKEKKITLKPGLDGEKLREVLLHEMIHAYEYGLENYCRGYYQPYVILKLYDKLKDKKDVMEHVTRDLRENFSKPTFHTTLFLLKSLDLDLELGKDLGTIYAYKRTEIFSKLEETNETD
jgi:hypothetical protein